jgi:hypothetical protein
LRRGGRAAKHAGRTVLICWHHGKIPHLTKAVLGKAKNAERLNGRIPSHWDDAVFDRIWQITFDNQEKATFANRPQALLFKDREN